MKALRSARIRTVTRLLEAAAKEAGRKALAVETGLDEKRLLKLADMADRMRIKGLDKEYAALLSAVGVDTVRDLQYRDPERLALAIVAFNKKRALVRFTPSVRMVARWIEAAKKLPPRIS